MGVTVLGRKIEDVSVVDDSDEVRTSYKYAIDEAALTPVLEEGPLPGLDDFTEELLGRSDAVLCDHHLRVRLYSGFEGAELAARCYLCGFPAILCTAWEGASIDTIRHYRRHIPVLLQPAELDPDTLIRGLEEVVFELEKGPKAPRRLWRTQVVVADLDLVSADPRVFVEVPGWISDQVISLPLAALGLSDSNALSMGSRLHARVNLGASRPEDLFFAEWEME